MIFFFHSFSLFFFYRRLHNNQFSGSLPTEIANISPFEMYNFHSFLPLSSHFFINLFFFRSLNNNAFEGDIPAMSSPFRLYDISFKFLSLTAFFFLFSYDFFFLSDLSFRFMQHNKFTGTFPQSLFDTFTLYNFFFLNLIIFFSVFFFNLKFPFPCSSLSSFLLLRDLSHNSLKGTIPSSQFGPVNL